MSYMAGLVVRASNVEKLLEDMNSFGRQAFMDAGATDMWITQSVMAGDGYGEIFITSDWDSIDAAVSAPDELRARPEFIDVMQNAGIQTLRRSLMQIHTQRGELTGKYGSLILVQALSRTRTQLSLMLTQFGVTWVRIPMVFDGRKPWLPVL